MSRERRRRQPGPDSFDSGDVTGTVYRYVVWRNDASCGDSLSRHPGLQADRRRGEARHARQPGGANAATSKSSRTSSTRPTAPRTTRSRTPKATSSPRSSSSSPTRPARRRRNRREEIIGDHLLHNTLGTCASGPQTGTTPGAPDALLLGGPPDPAPEDPTNPPLYDYSNDTYLEPTPDTDKGVQIRRDDTSGCHYTPTGTTNPESQVHRWVTDPCAADFKMTGKVTLEFYTRTLNNGSTPAQLCVYLFDRARSRLLGSRPTRC